MSDEIVIHKISLDAFISVLVELYNKGVDYIDLSAERGERQDKMNIIVTSDYMSSDATKEEIEPIEISTKLTDEDLNQLL